MKLIFVIYNTFLHTLNENKNLQETEKIKIKNKTRRK